MISFDSDNILKRPADYIFIFIYQLSATDTGNYLISGSGSNETYIHNKYTHYITFQNFVLIYGSYEQPFMHEGYYNNLRSLLGPQGYYK
jgi:hypothetical protein